jgi:hypothetical protein
VVRAVAILAVAPLGLAVASPASARQEYPSAPCTASNTGAVDYVINAAEVNPTLTHFLSINITAGTTGERTETLSRLNTVTTSIGASTEISSSAGMIFAKVSAKVGFTVQHTTSTTDTETTTMRWTFTQPGYYGLYKGTRAVAGTYASFTCRSLFGNHLWMMEPPFPTSYTTYDTIEMGTIRCEDSVPAGSLRLKAQLQLGC